MFRRRLVLIHPVVGAVIFGTALVGLRLIINWVVSETNPKLPFWSALSQLLGPGTGSTVAALAVYILLRNQRRQRELLASLNHELRNALQVIVYLIPHAEESYREAARGAVERIKKAVREISEQLGA